MRHAATLLRCAVAACVLLSAIACGDDSKSGIDASIPPRDGDVPDADPNRPDAGADMPDAAILPGGGTFTLRNIDVDQSHGQGTELVDIDRDGDLDVVATFSRTDSVYLYLNDDGDGSAWTLVPVAGQDTIVAMDAVARDFDGDGDIDIAAIGLFERGNDFTSPGEVTWFENLGGATSWARREITGLTFWGPRAMASADMNGDDRPDIVVAAIRIDNSGNGVYWFRNTGSGFDGPLAVDADLSQATSVHVADIDGDGDRDIVSAGYYADQVVWYESSGGQTPTFTGNEIGGARDTYAVFPANLDADSDIEVIATHEGGIVWYDAPADPTQPWTEHGIAPSPSPGDRSDIVLYANDLNGDGAVDVAVSARHTQVVRVYLRDGDGWMERPVADGYAASFVNGGDIDGDGHLDLVTSAYDDADGDHLLWWHNGE